MPDHHSVVVSGARPVRRVRLRGWRWTCAAAAGIVLLAMAIQLALPGGARAYPAGLGICGILLALVGVVFAAGADGDRALAPKAASGTARLRCRPYRALAAAAGLLSAFVALAGLVHLPGVQSADDAWVSQAFLSGGRGVTRFMRDVSGVGGREVALYWVPALALALAGIGRARSIRLFLFTMVGSFGLEVTAKTLSHRARPPFSGRSHWDSYPSGHALAASLLAFSLLALLLPACRAAWQRALLWTAALAWPLLMSSSRVYLGRHYVTDVGGAILLGGGWVCLTFAVFQTLVLADWGRERT